MIIQIAFSSIGFERGRKYCMNQFFGGCFAITSGNGNKRNAELLR